MSLPTVRINRKGAGRVASGHPWVFLSDVLDPGEAAKGDAVRVIDPGNQVLGVAHFSSTSQICLRMLSSRVEPIGKEFFKQRIETALAFRRRLVSGTNAYRLVHSEADMLPGLVVDRYGEYVVAQMLAQGMDRASSLIVEALEELLSPLGIVARNDAAVRKREELPLEIRVVSGAVEGPVPIQVNGLELQANLLHGQKTGVFLDQRENYRAAAWYAKQSGKPGAALDCFTSTGGFALHLAASCETVEGVDSSPEALQTAAANATANDIANVSFRQADVFDLLGGYSDARRKFNTVVLDPPAFAKSRTAIDAALRGYKEINQRAMRLMDSGGLLVTCSCSHHVSEAMLLEVVAAASLDTHRTLRVLDRRTQSQDHPILLTVPETHYLKCLILEVV